MRRAILITGYANWGKTTLIQRLFSGKKNFKAGGVFQMTGIPAGFAVETHSNDDVNQERYLATIAARLEATADYRLDLLSALCPTATPRNDSRLILTSEPFRVFDQIHLLAVKYKWDLNAELRIEHIAEQFSHIPKVRVHDISENPASNPQQRGQERLDEIKNTMREIYFSGGN